MFQFWLLYFWLLICDHVLGLFFLVVLGENAHLCAGSDNGDCCEWIGPLIKFPSFDCFSCQLLPVSKAGVFGCPKEFDLCPLPGPGPMATPLLLWSRLSLGPCWEVCVSWIWALPPRCGSHGLRSAMAFLEPELSRRNVGFGVWNTQRASLPPSLDLGDHRLVLTYFSFSPWGALLSATWSESHLSPLICKRSVSPESSESKAGLQPHCKVGKTPN